MRRLISWRVPTCGGEARYGYDPCPDVRWFWAGLLFAGVAVVARVMASAAGGKR